MLKKEQHKKFFDTTLTKKDLQKPRPKAKRHKKPPDIDVKAVEKLNSDAEIIGHMEKVVEHFMKIGLPVKALLLKEIFDRPETNAQDLRNHIEKKKNDNKANELSSEEGLATLLRLDLSRAQYQSIKNISDAQNAHFLPNYDDVFEEKKKCLPPNIEITEDSAKVSLEDMMLHTFDRHMEDPVFRSMVERLVERNGGEKTKLQFCYKAGYDVASGQSQFKVSAISFFFSSIQRIVVEFKFDFSQPFFSNKSFKHVSEHSILQMSFKGVVHHYFKGN